MKKYVPAAALRAPLFAVLLVCAIGTVADAQSIPAPWTAADIGAPALSGSATQSAGVFTISAAGTEIDGTTDQFRFVYQAVAGDVDVTARVDSVSLADAWSNAGLMIRSSLSATAAHGYVLATPSSTTGLYYRRRLSNGGTTSTTAGAKLGLPVWLRLARRGTSVTASSSTNGSTWTTIGTSTISLSSTAYVGIAVNSDNVSARTTAAVSNVTVTNAGALPNGQKNADLGAPAIAGSTIYASGTYTIKAAGADIWDVADQFQFVYQPVSGDVEVLARVASVVNTHAWAKAGVMIRESLTANSRHVLAAVAAANGHAFQRRAEPGTYSESTSGGSGTPPAWVKLLRRGDLFESFRSADGVTWTRTGSDTIPMGNTVYVGLAATSHNVSAATTAVVDSLKITASTAPGNQSPAVSVTAPVSGTSVSAPSTVTITATASDPENRMASVDFYAGPTMILRDTTAPYSAPWSASTAGTYALTAVAYDQDGGSSTSSAVNVTVTSANKPPTVSLATGGTSFTPPATINLTATAADPEGQLSRVEFFNGTARLVSDTTAPYSFSWTGVAAGTYSVRAVAYDSAGASATTATVTVTVAAATTTGPPKTLIFTASTNHSSSVTSYMLKVFRAGVSTTTGTPTASSDLGKPTPASNNDITVDRATFFSSLPAGSYVLTVTAIGPGGQTPSSSLAFTR